MPSRPGRATRRPGLLVLFAKIYDVAPDGTQEPQHRLNSPVRVADVTGPVTVELPGVVQRFRAGHRIRVVLAATDAAYAGTNVVQPVTVRTGPAPPGSLRMPLTGPLAFRQQPGSVGGPHRAGADPDAECADQQRGEAAL